MKKIYVVIAEGGSYEDSWKINEIATESLKAAETWMQNQIAEDEKLAELSQRFYERLDAEVAAYEIPKPEPLDYIERPVPKWNPVKGQPQKITPEEREIRNVIRRENENARELAYLGVREWEETFYAWQSATESRIASEVGISIEAARSYRRRYSDDIPVYYIEELDMI